MIVQKVNVNSVVEFKTAAITTTAEQAEIILEDVDEMRLYYNH